MSLITKLRQYFSIPWVRRIFGRRPPRPGPDEPPGSAGVGAKLPPRVPTLSGANAKPFPPVEE